MDTFNIENEFIWFIILVIPDIASRQQCREIIPVTSLGFGHMVEIARINRPISMIKIVLFFRHFISHSIDNTGYRSAGIKCPPLTDPPRMLVRFVT